MQEWAGKQREEPIGRWGDGWGNADGSSLRLGSARREKAQFRNSLSPLCVCVCVCVYTHTYAHTHTHICIYMYI